MDNLQDDLDKKRRTYDLVNSDNWNFLKDRLAEHLVGIFSAQSTEGKPYEEIGMQVVANQMTQKAIDAFITSLEGEAQQYVLDVKALEDQRPKMIHTF